MLGIGVAQFRHAGCKLSAFTLRLLRYTELDARGSVLGLTILRYYLRKLEDDERAFSL